MEYSFTFFDGLFPIFWTGQKHSHKSGQLKCGAHHLSMIFAPLQTHPSLIPSSFSLSHQPSKPIYNELILMSNVKLVDLPVPEGQPKVTVVDNTSRIGGQRYATTILRIMYSAIFLYSVAVGFIAGCPWWAMIGWYIWGMISFFLWHYQAHHKVWWVPFNEYCYAEHKKHHWTVYPPDAFFGKPGYEVTSQGWFGYFNPADWVTQHEGLLYFLMLLPIVSCKLFTSMSNGQLVGAVLGYVLMGIVGNGLHHAFHVKDIWLTKYTWFHELRALHYVHHMGDAHHNYAVLNLSVDRWLGSLALNVDDKGEENHEKLVEANIAILDKQATEAIAAEGKKA